MIDMTKTANELGLNKRRFIKVNEDGTFSASTLQINWLSGSLEYLRDVRGHLQIVETVLGENEKLDDVYTANLQDGITVSVSKAALPMTEEEIVTAAQDSLDTARSMKISEISTAFYNEMTVGVVATGFGWDIDARRCDKKDDLDNMRNLVEEMELEGMTESYVMGADNELHLCTLEDVKTLINILRKEGLRRFNKKFALRTATNSATTVEEIEAISW